MKDQDRFHVDDQVFIPGHKYPREPLLARIVQIDFKRRRIMIEFVGGPDDGLEEWWPMDSFGSGE